MKKKVIKHLKGDIKDFKEEAAEDRSLIKSLKKGDKVNKRVKKVSHKKKDKYSKKAEKKISKVMREGYAGKLHSGSKKGPLVKNPEQMKAIALSEARRKGLKVPKRKKKK